MVFSSLVFLCVFLPVVFLLYTVVPSLRVKNVLLIAASLIFYAYGEPAYVLLMIGSSAANYVLALLIDKSGRPGVRKLILAAAVAANLGVLGFFKYTGFVLESFNALTGLGVPVPQITLPIGISFFTFQALSYVIDVYRRDVPADKNFLHILLYISFFPQLIAGPIVKYHDINAAIADRRQTTEAVAAGLRRFICGLGKKVIIANVMGQTADAVFAAAPESLHFAAAWLGAAAYMLQIYYDFSGYSDMAIGLGKMFGFEIKENFNYPYTAVSIQDFWRRWHISMSTWFKNYLYIPLGGNRKGKFRTALNRIIVFFCTGLWHGANWTFVVWGLYHGFFLLLESYIPALKKMPRLLGRLYSLLVVCIGFVVFRADTLSQGVTFIARMFSFGPLDFENKALLLGQLTPWFLVILVAAVVGAGFLRRPVEKLRQSLGGEVAALPRARTEIVLSAGALILLIWCVLRLSGQGYNPFIYFRF